MTVLLAATIAVLFGAGAFLMTKRDLVRVVLGTTLIGNSAILFTIAARGSSGPAPILPVPADTAVSDPLVQALALTALVINFAVTALLLVLVWCLHHTHGSLDLEQLAQEEVLDETTDEREEESI